MNRVGLESPIGGPGIEFWGQSFVVAPSGEIIAKASVDQEEILIADVEWKRWMPSHPLAVFCAIDASMRIPRSLSALSTHSRLSAWFRRGDKAP